MTPYVYTTTSNNNHNHNLNEVPPESHVARYPIFALQREFNNLVIQTCSKLHLSDEIEFFCIDVFETYMENLFNNVNMLVVKRLEKHPITQNDSDTQLLELKMFIDECLQKVEKEFLLGIFSLVSVKSKYSDSSGWALQYRFMQSMLQKTNAPCTFKHMRCAEFEAFKNIGFNIKRSTTLKVLGSLIKICAKEVNWSDSVAEYIYEVAVKILRLVCVERERVYGRIRSEFNSMSFMSDKTLLDVCAILAAGHTLNLGDMENLLNLLSVQTKYTKTDILSLSNSILDLLN